MTLETYQKEAAKTARYPEAYRLLYPTLGLVGEAGEVGVVADHRRCRNLGRR